MLSLYMHTLSTPFKYVVIHPKKFYLSNIQNFLNCCVNNCSAKSCSCICQAGSRTYTEPYKNTHCTNGDSKTLKSNLKFLVEKVVT
jgi:hypothetical protein